MITLLDRAVTLLDAYGEQHWSAWMTRCRNALADGDTSAISKILEAYGGMGSFNDVTLHRPARLRSAAEIALEPPPPPDDERIDDLALHQLRGEIYNSANTLSRRLNR